MALAGVGGEGAFEPMIVIYIYIYLILILAEWAYRPYGFYFKPKRPRKKFGCYGGKRLKYEYCAIVFA